jgi:hypothetical protein
MGPWSSLGGSLGICLQFDNFRGVQNRRLVAFHGTFPLCFQFTAAILSATTLGVRNVTFLSLSKFGFV